MFKFKKIYIEITNVCNMSCSFCPPTQRAPKFMSVEAFKKIIDSIKGHTASLYLHVKGEPLMHPDFEELVKIAGNAGFVVNITTNGTLINDKSDFILSDSTIRQFNISLHSHSADEPISKFRSYIGNIIEFVKKALVTKRPFVSLRLWNLTFDKTSDNMLEENRPLLSELEALFGLERKIDESLSKKCAIKLAENVFINFQTRFEWPDINLSNRETKGYCRGLIEHIAILVDGSVVPCCLDSDGDAILGNLNNNTLEEILNGKFALAMREGLRNGKLLHKLCINCTYRERFKSGTTY